MVKDFVDVGDMGLFQGPSQTLSEEQDKLMHIKRLTLVLKDSLFLYFIPAVSLFHSPNLRCLPVSSNLCMDEVFSSFSPVYVSNMFKFFLDNLLTAMNSIK